MTINLPKQLNRRLLVLFQALVSEAAVIPSSSKREQFIVLGLVLLWLVGEYTGVVFLHQALL